MSAANETVRSAGTDKPSLALLEALPSNCAILDDQGTIVMVNQAWRDFAQHNQARCPNAYLGSNYLAVCDRAAIEGVPQAVAAADAIRRAFANESSCELVEYPCHSPTESRWFRMRTVRLQALKPVRVLVVHENISTLTQLWLDRQWAENCFLRFLDSLGYIVVRLTPDGQILGMNTIGEQIFPCSQQPLVGEDFHEALVSPEWQIQSREALALARKGMILPRLRLGLRGRDETSFLVEGTFTVDWNSQRRATLLGCFQVCSLSSIHAQLPTSRPRSSTEQTDRDDPHQSVNAEFGSVDSGISQQMRNLSSQLRSLLHDLTNLLTPLVLYIETWRSQMLDLDLLETLVQRGERMAARLRLVQEQLQLAASTGFSLTEKHAENTQGTTCENPQSRCE